MTKKQLLQKVKYLYKAQLQDRYIDKKVEALIKSGMVDIEKYEDDYMLPKAFLCALLAELEFQYQPLTKEGKTVAEKIKLAL